MRTPKTTVLFAIFALLAIPAFGQTPNWAEVAAEEEILITVTQEDGTPREVTIWLVVLDDQGYFRTRNTSWRGDLERDRDVTLRIAGADYAVRANSVSDEALTDRIHETFTEKYGGVPNFFLNIMRPFMGSWNVYRADPRE